jgi:hypothetical protein
LWVFFLICTPVGTIGILHEQIFHLLKL